MKGLGTAAASAAVIMLSGVGGAHAADLGPYPVKALPAGPAVCTSILDFFTSACQLSAYGVRFYGTIDVGYGYESAGTTPSNLIGADTYLGKPSKGGLWTLSPNAMSVSNVGFQIKEPLGAGWSFVGQVESGFDPISMQLLNGPASLRQQIGVPLASQPAGNDSSFNGTFYNDLGFAGFSHDTWGTLTFGRQNSLLADQVLSYDPQGSAAAFSTLGIIGTYAGGGDTEDRRDTTAIKYRVNFANWHFGAYAQVGGYEQGNASTGAYYGNAGADYHVGPGLFSFDVTGGWRQNAVAEGVGGINGPTNADGYPTQAAISSPTLNGEFLSATISDNSSVMASAKYQWDRLKLFGGYELIAYSSGDFTGTSFIDESGLGVGTGYAGTSLKTTTYDGRRLNIAWFGGKYALTDSLDLTAAYYHVWQNEFVTGGVVTIFTNPTVPGAVAGHTTLATGCAGNPSASIQCSGTQDIASAVLDWKFAPKWDTYIGTEYVGGSGGLISGFLSSYQWATTAGIRFRW
jgi:predicted porin